MDHKSLFAGCSRGSVATWIRLTDIWSSSVTAVPPLSTQLLEGHTWSSEEGKEHPPTQPDQLKTKYILLMLYHNISKLKFRAHKQYRHSPENLKNLRSKDRQEIGQTWWIKVIWSCPVCLLEDNRSLEEDNHNLESPQFFIHNWHSIRTQNLPSMPRNRTKWLKTMRKQTTGTDPQVFHIPSL